MKLLCYDGTRELDYIKDSKKMLIGCACFNFVPWKICCMNAAPEQMVDGVSMKGLGGG